MFMINNCGNIAICGVFYKHYRNLIVTYAMRVLSWQFTIGQNDAIIHRQCAHLNYTFNYNSAIPIHMSCHYTFKYHVAIHLLM